MKHMFISLINITMDGIIMILLVVGVFYALHKTLPNETSKTQ